MLTIPTRSFIMPTITINGETKSLPEAITVAELLQQLGKDAKKLAVEVNRELVSRPRHTGVVLKDGDAVEIVTLVGGGAAIDPPQDKPLKVGKFIFQSRLFTGTGKYTSYELMQRCMDASGCDVTTVAVRRERLIDKDGKNILDFLNLKRLTILPNTAGCFSAEDAIRHARLARELLTNLENPGADWVKLECLADKRTLLPDPVDTLKATEQLVKDGFTVLVYTSDDPVLAKRLKEAGAASVMPAGSPIGSGQGILNPNNIRICLEYLKENDPEYPVIVDAGVGTASDVSAAMELGCDGVLLNTAIASAKDPLRMAWAMRYATDAGRLAYLAGRIPKRLYANASSPTEGLIATSGAK
jgi:thiazole synthase